MPEPGTEGREGWGARGEATKENLGRSKTGQAAASGGFVAAEQNTLRAWPGGSCSIPDGR